MRPARRFSRSDHGAETCQICQRSRAAGQGPTLQSPTRRKTGVLWGVRQSGLTRQCALTHRSNTCGRFAQSDTAVANLISTDCYFYQLGSSEFCLRRKPPKRRLRGHRRSHALGSVLSRSRDSWGVPVIVESGGTFFGLKTCVHVPRARNVKLFQFFERRYT